MNPKVVHFHFPIFGTLFIPIDNTEAFRLLDSAYRKFVFVMNTTVNVVTQYRYSQYYSYHV